MWGRRIVGEKQSGGEIKKINYLHLNWGDWGERGTLRNDIEMLRTVVGVTRLKAEGL
jgi:hypothetical protein